ETRRTHEEFHARRPGGTALRRAGLTGDERRIGSDLRRARQRNLPDEPAASIARPCADRRLDTADDRGTCDAGTQAELSRSRCDDVCVWLGPGLNGPPLKSRTAAFRKESGCQLEIRLAGLEANPDAVAPVSAAGMFAPYIVIV